LCAVRSHGHDALAAAGMVPALGILPDLLDSGLYLLEGDFANASLAGLAAIPILGDAARVGQYGGKALRRLSRSTGLLETTVITDPRRLLSITRENQQKLVTVLGSGKDVSIFKGKKGYNALSMDASLPLSTRKEINRQWLNEAIDRGDEIHLMTDPIKWEKFMRDIGKSSFYNDVELPLLLERGALDRAIAKY